MLTRIIGILLVLLWQQPAPKPDEELDRRIAKAARALVPDHLAIAKKCRELKLHKQAAKEWTQVLALDPSNAEARAGLGYKLVSGEWQGPSASNPTDSSREGMDEIWLRRGALGKKAVKELTPALDFAEKQGLPKRARELALRMLEYDPNAAPARKALGHVSTSDGWRPKAEIEEAAQLAKLINETSAPTPAKGSGGFEAELGLKLRRFESPNYRIEGTLDDAEIQEVGRLAEAAIRDVTQRTGLAMPKSLAAMSLVLCKSKSDYDKAIDTICDATDAKDRDHWKSITTAPLRPKYSYILGVREAATHYADTVVHLSSHALLTEWCKPTYPPLWLQEGAAAWSTARITKSNQMACVARGTTESNRVWTGTNPWRSTAREWARDGGGPTLRQVMESTLQTMDADRCVVAWSVFDYLIRERAPELRVYLARIAAGETGEGSLQKAFAVKDSAELEAQWRAYVREAY